MPGSPVDSCTGCGQTDDHPKDHVYTADPTRPWVSWHKDCHANTGCETCKSELAAIQGYESGIIGEELRSMIVAHHEKVAQAGSDK